MLIQIITKVLLQENYYWEHLLKLTVKILLNRYSFFEELQDKRLPNMKIDLDIEFDDDKNLIWRGGAADAAGTSYLLIIRRLQLFIPRLVFNSEGQKLYMENYLKSYKWTYLNESVFTNNLSTEKSGHFRITNGISKPRHAFVFFINNANINTNLKIHSCIILSACLLIQER